MVEDLHANAERSIEGMKASSFGVLRNVLLKCKLNKFWSAHIFLPFEAFLQMGSCKGNSLHSHANSLLGLVTWFLS